MATHEKLNPRQIVTQVGSPAASFIKNAQDTEQDSLIDKGRVINVLSNLFLELLADDKALKNSQDPASYIAQKVYNTFGSFYNKDCHDPQEFNNICKALKFHSNREIGHPVNYLSLQKYQRELISRGLAAVDSVLNINWQTKDSDLETDNLFDNKDIEIRFEKVAQLQKGLLHGYILMSVYAGDLSGDGKVNIGKFFEYHHDNTRASTALDGLTLLRVELLTDGNQTNLGGSAKDSFVTHRREFLKARVMELLKVCIKSHLEHAKKEYLVSGELKDWLKNELLDTRGNLVEALSGSSLQCLKVRSEIARDGQEAYKIPGIVGHTLGHALSAWGIITENFLAPVRTRNSNTFSFDLVDALNILEHELSYQEYDRV